MKTAPELELTLHGPPPAGAVGVRLRRFGERWVASSGAPGVRTAMGLSARAALTAAIEPLGHSAVRVMLADVALLGPSLAVVEAEKESGIGA